MDQTSLQGVQNNNQTGTSVSGEPNQISSGSGQTIGSGIINIGGMMASSNQLGRKGNPINNNFIEE